MTYDTQIMLRISHRVSIDEGELRFVASRSAGPGGQHVNKVNSRVTLRFDLEATPSLDEEQKAQVRERLATRISKDGILTVSAQKERSQSANRQRATERFVELLQEALAVPRERRPTRVPRRSQRRRLEDKRRRSSVKDQRRKPRPQDD